MRRFFAYTSPALVSLLVASNADATAADAFLCSDAFSAGTADFQNGFIGGEEAAERIDPPASALPYTITSAYLFFGQNGDLNATSETIKIYDVDGTDFTGSPGTVLGSTPAALVDSTDSIQQVAFGTPVTVNGPFWIALHFDQGASPEPGPATDGTQSSSTKAALLASDVGFYEQASAFGVHGDWVLRVEGTSATSINDAACRVGGGGEGEGEGSDGGEGSSPISGEGEGEGRPGGGEGEGEGAATGVFITSVNPSQASAGTDTKVTITGSGFSAHTVVRVGSASCGDVAVQNAGALLCTVPGSLGVGTYDVIAQNDADVFVFPSGFEVTPTDAAAQPNGCTCNATQPNATELSATLLALCSLRALRKGQRRSASRA